MWNVAPSTASPAVLVTTMVGAELTAVVSVSELLAGVLSFGDVTLAVLLRPCSVAGAVTTIVIVELLLRARSARSHVTVVIPPDVLLEQVQPAAVVDTQVVPEGRASVTVRFVALIVVE